MSACMIDGCRKPRRYQARQLCEMHYARWRRNGTTDLVRVHRTSCAVPGCVRPHEARGWCKAHYEQWRVTGNVAPRPPRPRRLCGIEGCGRPHGSRGWCKGHYEQWRKHGRITNTVILVRQPRIPSPLPEAEVARLRRAVGLEVAA